MKRPRRRRLLQRCRFGPAVLEHLCCLSAVYALLGRALPCNLAKPDTFSGSLSCSGNCPCLSLLSLACTSIARREPNAVPLPPSCCRQPKKQQGTQQQEAPAPHPAPRSGAHQVAHQPAHATGSCICPMMCEDYSNCGSKILPDWSLGITEGHRPDFLLPSQTQCLFWVCSLQKGSWYMLAMLAAASVS